MLRGARVRVREIHCSRWFLNRNIAAITLYPFIFYRRDHRSYKYDFDALRHHEMVHIRQVRENGWFKFYTTYLWESWKHGYMGNKYEKEAYASEANYRKLKK